MVDNNTSVGATGATGVVGSIDIESINPDMLVDVPEIDPNRCTRDDEFKTEPCRCPKCLSPEGNGNSEHRKYIQKGVVVTDNDLIPEEIKQWCGYTFVCPICKQQSILDYMKFCPNCGMRVLIRSHKVAKFVENFELRNKAMDSKLNQ